MVSGFWAVILAKALCVWANHPTTGNGGRIIQSSLGLGNQWHDFELVVLEATDGGNELVHYWRDNGAVTRPWVRGPVITNRASSSGTLIQNSKNSNLEVLVQELNHEIVHYTREGINWIRGEVVTRQSSGAPSMIQNSKGNFDALILEGRNLIHYHKDNGSPNGKWVKGATLTSKANGPGSIIQTTFGGNLEAVALEEDNLKHYVTSTSKTAVGQQWDKGTRIAQAHGNSPGALLQSTVIGPYKGPKATNAGNFEVLVYTKGKPGDWRHGNLTHWSRDNSERGKYVWKKYKVITDHAIGSGSIMQSSFGDPNNPGNMELVVLEDPKNLVHYFRASASNNADWYRTAIISTKAIG